MDYRPEGVKPGDPPDPRAREIRSEIERTRDDMTETIDAIQERLRPGNIVAEAKDRVREATTEKVRHMANRASDVAERQNLLPAALIGIGAAWLLINRSSNRSRSYDSNGPAWRNTEYSSSEDYYRAVGTQGSSYGSGADVSGMAGRAREVASEASGRAAEMARQTGETVRYRTRRAQNQLQRAINENPLAVGAAAMVLGAAVGLALPETERENRLMGEARDTVLDKAQDMAKDAADRVKDAASDAVTGSIMGKSDE
jgi:hypothetical protein